jgi:hypothetical protein
MSEELVYVPPQPAAIQRTESLGLDGFSLKPALMKLVQRTTTDDGAAPGKLFDTLSKANTDSIQVVPLSIRMGRVLFPPGGELGAEPICRSDDGEVPSPNALSPQSPTCATCDSGPKLWKNYKSTGKKPDCNEKFRMLFVTRDSGLPYYINISGKSISNLKSLKDAIYRDVVSARMKGQTLSLFDYTFEMKPVFVQGKKGSYYVLTFVNLQRVANPGEFGAAFEEFVSRQRALDSAEATDQIIEGELVEDEQQSV